ncbi:MAG: DUF6378 domain-containing protein [Clostridiales bacterium]|nr:DUF6378 domain-containing protein [Clostridiales bacterium]
MTRSEVLNAAEKCVCEDRDKQYGSPEDNFARIAALWSNYKGFTFTPKDVSVMMVLVKVARLSSGDSIGNYVDIAGYAACGGEISSNNEINKKNVAAESIEPKKPAEIYKIPYKQWKLIIKQGMENVPREKFYFHNGIEWIGVDNSTGELWTEEFLTEKGCVAWLEDDYASEDFEEETE